MTSRFSYRKKGTSQTYIASCLTVKMYAQYGEVKTKRKKERRKERKRVKKHWQKVDRLELNRPNHIILSCLTTLRQLSMCQKSLGFKIRRCSVFFSFSWNDVYNVEHIHEN